MPAMIEVEQLRKRFGDTTALEDVTLQVAEGTVLALLGPNGAGKTTTIRVLATLLAPDAGHATIAGIDVVNAPGRVRSMIGLTGQYAAVDEKLTGIENLQLVGRLLGFTKRAAAARAGELLDRFDLRDAGGRRVATYSGGMRRRVDLAISLVGRPRVLFLDEPTTGLDPASRLHLWGIVRELVASGTTVLLTTQYLEEADRLSDRIVVIDRGAVIDEGTGDQLKDRVGGRTLEIELADPWQLDTAGELARRRCGQEPRLDVDTRTVSVQVGHDTELAARVVAELSSASISIVDFRFQRPTLDQVFLTLTGRTTADGGTAASSSPTLAETEGARP